MLSMIFNLNQLVLKRRRNAVLNGTDAVMMSDDGWR
jgi:hypothetical protein